MKLVIASRNGKKVEEISRILGEALGLEVCSLDDVDQSIPEIEEDTDTFQGNAVKKAVVVAAKTGLLCLADDSGLEVFSLGGKPGVYSARFAGEHKSDEDNNRKLLDLLVDKPDRRARFVCYIALADRNGLIGLVSGQVRGKIAFRPKGKNGFGYDPVFVPYGYDKTFAQLSSREKDKISHRRRALRKARRVIKDYLISLNFLPL